MTNCFHLSYRAVDLKKGYLPNNAKHIFTEDSMEHEDAYEKAMQLIMQDPEHNICEITWWWFTWGYTSECWTASDTKSTTFGSGGGNHVLFFMKYCLNGNTMMCLFEDESKLISTTLN